MGSNKYNCCKHRPNYGIPTCIKNIGVTTRLYFQLKYDNEGHLNKKKIDEIDFNFLALNLVLNDESKRWYPTGSLRNVAYDLSDSIFEEASNNQKSFIRNPIRTLTGELWDDAGNNVIKSKLESKRCDKWTFYIITAQNQIVGEKYVEDGVEYFKGIDISAQSIDPRFMFKQNISTLKTTLSFDFEDTNIDSCLYSICGNELWDGINENINFIDFKSPKNIIIDANIKIINIEDNVIEIIVSDDYKQGEKFSIENKYGNITGLGINDFELFNNDTKTFLNINSVNEINKGNYILTLDSEPTIENHLTLKLKIIENINLYIQYNAKVNFKINGINVLFSNEEVVLFSNLEEVFFN